MKKIIMISALLLSIGSLIAMEPAAKVEAARARNPRQFDLFVQRNNWPLLQSRFGVTQQEVEAWQGAPAPAEMPPKEKEEEEEVPTPAPTPAPVGTTPLASQFGEELKAVQDAYKAVVQAINAKTDWDAATKRNAQRELQAALVA